MDSLGTFYSNLLYFTDIWYTLLSFGILFGDLADIFPLLVRCTKKNLATLPTNLDLK
jgi:hypothetical protein